MTTEDHHHPSYPLYERKDDPKRGRHLVAKQHISKGRLIFCERPLVALQSLGNPAWVCHCCKAFVGGPYAALKILATHSLPNIDENNENDCNDNEEQSQWTVVPCRHNCGQVYCSKECEQDFWKSRHRFLCTGELKDDNNPLVEYKKYAMETNEIFLLVAEWIAGAYTYKQQQKQQMTKNNSSNENGCNPWEDFLMEPWWDLQQEGDEAANNQEREVLKQLCERACQLWLQHWQSIASDDGDVATPVTPLYMANIIGACELNSIGIRRRSPLCRDIFSSKLRHDCKKELLKCLEQVGMLPGEEEDHDEEENSQQNSLEYTDDEIARFLSDLEIYEEAAPKKEPQTTKNNIDSNNDGNEEEDDDDDSSGCEDCGEQEQDDLDEIFPPMDGTAMYALTCKMNHSCDPNVVALYKTRGWGSKHPLVAHCVALRDIEAGEELCISYIESEDPVWKRREALAHYGFNCNCTKCQRETAGDDDDDALQAGSEHKKKDNKEDEDFLFGSDDDDSDDEQDKQNEIENRGQKTSAETKDETNENPIGVGSVDGETALERCCERLDTVLNHSSMGSIPLMYFAKVSTFIIQTAISSRENIENVSCKDKEVVKNLLSVCITGLRERDFVLCKTVGTDLENLLFSMLQRHSSWPSIAFREAYWCGATTASVGLAHQCSFLPAMYLLDKATILGLPRQSIEDYFSYVEYHASQVATSPFQSATDSVVPDFSSSQHHDILANFALSGPIQFPLPEVSVSFLETSYISKSKPAVIREFAAKWPATRKWRNVSFLCREHGHRLVPIELGSIKSASGMKEELMTLRAFVSEYLVASNEKECWSLQDAVDTQQSKIAYLAQHPLIDQIPTLSNDLDMKPGPCGPLGPSHVYVWIGTGGTRTPLHFDSYANLFVQVVGVKYVRIYSHDETPKLYVSQKQSYSLQGNMSDVDCEQEDYGTFPLAKDVKYEEVLLLPGDALFIPARAWHYVRSVSTSVSVNYWF